MRAWSYAERFPNLQEKVRRKLMEGNMSNETITETYNVTYLCGCVRELQGVKGGFHRPTGKQDNCSEHKKKDSPV